MPQQEGRLPILKLIDIIIEMNKVNIDMCIVGIRS